MPFQIRYLTNVKIAAPTAAQEAGGQQERAAGLDSAGFVPLFRKRLGRYAAVAIATLCLLSGTAMLADALLQEQDGEPVSGGASAAAVSAVGDSGAAVRRTVEIDLTARLIGDGANISKKTEIGPINRNSVTPGGSASSSAETSAPAVSARFRKAEEPPQTAPQSQNPAPTPTPVPASELPYLIYVSKHSFTIAILGKDEGGEYTNLLHTFHTALGRTSGQTRAGNYTISGRERWHRWGSNSYSPYTTQHSGGLYFHGPVYTDKDTYALKPASYNEIGTSATAGCMRTYSSAAAWIYFNCPTGTPVTIANDSKYTSSPQPDIDLEQNYDPTDPDIETGTPDNVQSTPDSSLPVTPPPESFQDPTKLPEVIAS